MSYPTKNKLLIGLLVLLLLANIVTIAFFWLGRPKHPAPGFAQSPATYLVKELNLNSTQEQQFMELVKEHQQHAEALRQQIKAAKDKFFKLLQQPSVSDSEKIRAVKSISSITEQLDLVTFDHFKKVRAICNPQQQQKFDSIIQEVLQMVGRPRLGPGMPGPGGPRQGDREGPPPPGAEQGPPPHP